MFFQLLEFLYAIVAKVELKQIGQMIDCREDLDLIIRQVESN
jgi:hypothetical protein